MMAVYKYLYKINSPEDLKSLENQELEFLAHEIRKFLIYSVSKTGGHLASNLGVVELTLAVHKIFDSPRDKIIWDVGHQAYVHKILTGRKNKFDTLRQYKGLSGFPKRYESQHDAFDTGHSSTSISAALGMAIARDLKKETNHVVAIIGDGALTGGMAFEALNHAGQSQRDIIIILNDNGMSIAQNVGGLSTYLKRMRSSTIHSKPGIFFEEIGFKYMGPIDGHDCSLLCQTMETCKTIKGPVLLHLVTKKGKGYEFAENSPEKFHGIGPFKIDTGQTKDLHPAISYSEIAGNTLLQMAETNKQIIAITAAMSQGTGLEEFSKKFPERFFDVGIAEQHAVTFAAAMAAEGFKPFFAVYSSFLQRAYDQVIHDVCLQNLPVTILIDRAGLVGNDGETHHGTFDVSFLSCIPNLTFMAPKNGGELKRMIEYAVTWKGPVAIRYPRGITNLLDEQSCNKIHHGKGEIVYHDGNDVLIIALGTMNDIGLSLCHQLKEWGITATLLNPRFIKPMDESLIIENTKKHKRVYIIESSGKIGGFGSQVQLLLTENHINNDKVDILALPDQYIEHGSIEELYDSIGLTVEKMFNKIKKDISKT